MTPESPFRAAPRMSREGFIAVLRERDSFASAPLWAPTPLEEREAEAGALYDLIVSGGHDPAVWLAIAGKEHSFGANRQSVLWRNSSRSWTNARSVRDPALSGWRIITDSYRQSDYVAYARVRDSVADGLYRVDEPGFAYQRANARSIAEVIAIWAPGSDGNRPREYAQTMCEWINAWAARYPPPGGTVGQLRVALAAGHRNSDGGNAVEMSLVGHHCQAAARAFRAAGADVRVVTPDDGLGMFPEGLQAVGRRVVEWATAGWVADIFIEFHTQGVNNPAVRGAFVIYPDWGEDVDVAVRDRLGADMARRVAARVGIPVWRRGVMSERETNVGGQGWRLGVFLATAPIRTTTTRLLLESGAHTSPEDLAVLRRPETPQRIAEGVVEAVYHHYGQRPVESPPAPSEAPHATRYFPETRHLLGGGFLRFWQEHGGLAIFGYPLSEEFSDPETGHTVQWFERARFEHQPAIAGNPWGVVLGRLGAESLERDRERVPAAFAPREP